MIRYYLLLFIRNLQRQKWFSFINLLGLTVSITSTILIYLYVSHELSYDRFHENSDRIYRINQTFIWGEENDSQFASTGPGVAYAVKEEIAEVELMTSIHTPGDFIMSYTRPSQEVISFEETKVLAADTNFFRLFSFPLLKGQRESVLKQANTMVMTESTAKKYFGNEDPIGKMIRLGGLNGDNQQTFEVTGIAADTPDNTYLEFDILLSMKNYPIERLYWSWIWTQLETYVMLREDAKLSNVKMKLADIPKKHADETLRRAMNTTYDEYIKSGKKWELFIQPLTSIHLPAEPVLNRLSDAGDLKSIYSLIGAAAFIILLSCVNFMNLSTAQFTRRIKEASIRKILGLGKRELGISYFTEALAFCCIALIIALALIQILLPTFNLITGKPLNFNLFNEPTLVVTLLGLVVMMALVSSTYPALFLSKFHPVEAIKGKARAGREGKSFRNGLVVFQFSVSIFLMICTAIVFQQLKYVSEKDIGFDKENLLVLTHLEGVNNNKSLNDAALMIPGVENASRCTSLPPEVYGGDTFTADGLNGRKFSLNYTSADENYIPTLNIKLKFGRNFSVDNPGDVNSIILNETAISEIGWPLDESILGKFIAYGNDDTKFEVIGVVSDFHYWSLANDIEPMGIFHIDNKNLNVGSRQYLVTRMAPQNADAWGKTIGALNTLWKKHAGDTPFQYSFVDETFEETFATQQKFGKALTIMATLAIIIACLGLLGMIIYALEQRTKEIGIRKVSGASVMNILTLIAKGYAKLIIFAFVLSAPLSYWMMENWLSDFAYRITPSPWIFAIIGISTLAVAVLIIGYHSIRAAMTNPVDVLKDE